MKTVQIERFCTSPMGTFGRLAIEGDAFACYTVERPWADNARNISCIPCGVYGLERSFYHKGNYPAYEVVGVPQRSEIKLHKGNTYHDVAGCIALGLKLGTVDRYWAVLSSGTAYQDFMAAMDGVPHTQLEITARFTCTNP